MHDHSTGPLGSEMRQFYKPSWHGARAHEWLFSWAMLVAQSLAHSVQPVLSPPSPFLHFLADSRSQCGMGSKGTVCIPVPSPLGPRVLLPLHFCQQGDRGGRCLGRGLCPACPLGQGPLHHDMDP